MLTIRYIRKAIFSSKHKIHSNTKQIYCDHDLHTRCSATSRTPMLTPNNPWNESVTINISGCDSGKVRIGLNSLCYTEDHKTNLVSISQLNVSF